MKVIIIVIFAAIVLFSCNRKKEINPLTVKLVEVEKVKFQVSDDVIPLAINIEYLKGYIIYYLYILDGDNHLLVYNLDTRECIKKLDLEVEGNNGVGKATCFKVLSPESVLITSKFHQKLFLVNADGIVIDRYPFECDSLQTSYCNSGIDHPIVVNNDVFILPQNFVGNWNNLSTEYYNAYTTTICLNRSSGEITKSGMGFPFPQDEFTSPGFSYCYLNGQFIYSFDVVDSIYFLNSNGMVRSRYVGSPNIKSLPKKKILKTNSIESIVKDWVKSSHFAQIQSDTTQNIIYRFYRIGLENLTSDQNIMEIHRYPPRFGIQILDENGATIGDQVFPENQFFYHNSFVAKGILYISNNHPLGDDFDVDFFTFTAFKSEFNNED
ncbi:MAG: DUF4221 family protein [Draconibacterium sp.]